MASNAVRTPRYVHAANIIGHQPDLFDGPTVTHEVPRRSIVRDAEPQIRVWGRADTLGTWTP
ncbi:hypothetical protein [Sphingomonas sp. PAMC 26605]|uniref:hypothetical protein n=1 Tax=Sphingomonas sp. PAMC 26605 TaxID=1112214 RepID=UPI0002FBE570|nr:hypothetical protein [Sphingomonas sp. PAMC 26605]